MIFTRKDNCGSFGPVLNEYDRVCSVPGTVMFTYWPGRNTRSSRLGISTVKPTVLGENRCRSVIVAVYVAAAVFATSEVVAICSTRSDSGTIWHGRQNPCSASSSVSASSM